MMLKPSIDTLLDKVPSKYSLVILEAKRAHELEEGATPTQEFKSVKSTLRALEEIESGNVGIHPDPEGKREAVNLIFSFTEKCEVVRKCRLQKSLWMFL